MEKKDIRKIGLVFLLILLLAMGLDMKNVVLKEDGKLLRGEVGAEEEDIRLILDMEGMDNSVEYLLELEAALPTREEAEGYFNAAIQEIDADIETFLQAQDIFPRKEEYLSGVVEADWEFEPWNVIQADGSIYWEKLSEGENLVNVSVRLSCGEYEQIYQFSVPLVQKESTVEEKVLNALDVWMETEMAKEGEREVQLPTELEGITLEWSEEAEGLTLKILVLEGVAICLLWYFHQKKQQRDRQKLLEEMELDYPDVVEELALLLGAGMTIRQAWNRIATRYSDKRQKEQIAEKPVFERILRMNRRLLEGENEKIAYQKFADETNLMCYHRLVRLLLADLEKGTSGIYASLEQESRQAYEQRMNQAKKLGEEASTRMLLPLMLMMLVVMAIAIVPATVSFSI